MATVARAAPGSRAMAALALDEIVERRRSLLAWGLPLGLMSALVVAIYPSVEDAIGQAVRDYPPALKEAFGIGELTTVEEYLHAEMMSLIVPIAVGYLAIRSAASRLSGAAESGRLDVLLSAPVARWRVVAAAFAGAAVEVAAVLAVTALLTGLGSVLVGAGLGAGALAAAFANVWPLALLFAGATVVLTWTSLSTPVVTGTAAGVLVAMYVLDLVGRLASEVDWLRYGSVFRYYGNAAVDGVDPLTFAGVTAVAVALAVLGAALFQRRDITR